MAAGHVHNDEMVVLRWLGRSLDPRLPYHRMLLALMAVVTVTGLALVAVAGRPWWLPIGAVAAAGLGWAITREIDPDRESTAIVAGIGAGAWPLLEQPTHLIFMLGALGVARIVVATTGRRPKRQDLVAVSIGAVALSFTQLGFIAGFAVAVAVYIDNHYSDEPIRDALWASVAIAVGSGLVASATGAFSGEPTDLMPEPRRGGGFGGHRVGAARAADAHHPGRQQAKDLPRATQIALRPGIGRGDVPRRSSSRSGEQARGGPRPRGIDPGARLERSGASHPTSPLIPAP